MVTMGFVRSAFLLFFCLMSSLLMCLMVLLPSHPYRPHGLGGPWPVPATHGFAFLMKNENILIDLISQIQMHIHADGISWL